ncbi:MAG: hypothetical protein ACYC96_12235, partial [Fimbriimonadaceae bacterium]
FLQANRPNPHLSLDREYRLGELDNPVAGAGHPENRQAICRRRQPAPLERRGAARIATLSWPAITTDTRATV